MIPKRKILLILLSIFGIFVILLGLRVYYLLSDIDKNTHFLAKNIESLLRRRVTLGKIEVNLRGGLSIEVSNFCVKDEKGDQDIFAAKHLTFGIKLLPLFYKKLVFHKIIIDSPKIILIRAKSGRIDLPEGFSNFLKKEKRSSIDIRGILSPSLSFEKIRLFKGEILFIDYSFSQDSLLVKAEDLEFNCTERDFLKGFYYYLTGKVVNFGYQSSFLIKGWTNDIPKRDNLLKLYLKTEIELRNFPLEPFLPYYQDYFHPEDFKALINLKVVFKGNPYLTFHSKGEIEMNKVTLLYSKLFSNRFNPERVNLTYALERNHDNLKVTSFGLRLNNCFFNGSLSLRSIGSEDFFLSGELKSNRIQWSAFRQYLPLKLVSPGLAKFWKEGMVEGIFEVESFSFAGKVRDFIKIQNSVVSKIFRGKARISNFKLNLLDEMIPLRDLQGELILENENLLLKNFTGTIRGFPLKVTNGVIVSLYKMPVLNLMANADLDLSRMLSLFLHQKMPERIRSIFKGIKALKGQTEFTLKLSNISLTRQYYPPLFDGSLILSKVTLVYRKFPEISTVLNGKVNYSEKLITIEKLNGIFGNSNFQIKGRIKDWQELNPKFNILLDSEISHAEFKKFFKKGFFDKTNFEGECIFQGTLKGNLNKIEFSGNLDLTRCNYLLYRYLTKPKEVKNIIQFKGIYSREKYELQIADFKYILGTGVIKGGGRFSFKGKPLLNVSLNTKGILLEVLSSPELPDYRPAGVISGEIDIKWGRFKPKKIELIGNLKFEKVALVSRLSSKSLFVLDSSIIFKKDSFNLERLTFTTDKSSLNFSGSIEGITNPKIQLSCNSPFLKFDELLNLRKRLKQERGEKMEKGGREWISKISLKGDLIVNRGSYHGFPFSYLQSKIAMNEGILSFSQIEFKTGKGKVNADLNINLDKKEDTGINSSFRMKNLEFRDILELFSIKGDSFSGRLSLNGNLKTKFIENQRPLKFLNGDISFNLKEGRIQRFTILSKILTILNIYQIFKLNFDEFLSKGMPYKSIKGTLLLKDGVIYTEDLFLDSDQIRISAVGSVDLVRDELDFNLGVEPLVTVDKILNHIPVIGKIFTGKDKSLVVSYFKVRGNLHNPEVKVVPLKSLTRKVSSLLEQILGIPQQIIETPAKVLNHLE